MSGLDTGRCLPDALGSRSIARPGAMARSFWQHKVHPFKGLYWEIQTFEVFGGRCRNCVAVPYQFIFRCSKYGLDVVLQLSYVYASHLSDFHENCYEHHSISYDVVLFTKSEHKMLDILATEAIQTKQCVRWSSNSVLSKTESDYLELSHHVMSIYL